MDAPPPRAVTVQHTRLFINGAFVPAASGRTFATLNPATEEVLAHVDEAGEEDVEAAVAAAHAAGRPGSAWRALEPHQRGHLLARLADLVERDGEALADLEAADNGKPARMARLVDVGTAVRMLRYYAGWPDKLASATLPTAGGGLTYTRWEPVGVVAAILPFNFPMLGAVTKAAPALAAGNTVVVKPAEQTPLGALHLAALVAEAGFPPGVFNVVNGPGEVTGAALVAHPRVRKVTFTGSTAVGKLIQRVAADTLKRVTLELGGKNAALVLPDADVGDAVRIASGGNFFNSGQICVGISRVLVPDGMYDEFVERAAAKARSRTLGHQWSGADQGPQCSQEQLDRVLHYIDLGVKEGARLVCGGRRRPGPGYFVEPTVFADVTDGMAIAREEIFGPVMCVQRYTTVAEAVRRANATEYGLAATVISRDINAALPVAHALEVGTVWINDHGLFDAPAPYGGRKQSGLGREYGLEGMLPYMELKTVFITLPQLGPEAWE
jgi:acyl-CoA reductase-like NAD-dependent aldehyde dehydrogenase